MATTQTTQAAERAAMQAAVRSLARDMSAPRKVRFIAADGREEWRNLVPGAHIFPRGTVLRGKRSPFADGKGMPFAAPAAVAPATPLGSQTDVQAALAEARAQVEKLRKEAATMAELFKLVREGLLLSDNIEADRETLLGLLSDDPVTVNRAKTALYRVTFQAKAAQFGAKPAARPTPTLSADELRATARRDRCSIAQAAEFLLSQRAGCPKTF